MIIIPEDPKGELGPVDEQQIEAVYQRLARLHVELDPDPLEMGPKRLNGKIAECREHLSDCERVFSHLSQILHRYRRAHRAAAADYKLRLQELLTNDVEVRGGRASTDREAIASTKLRSQVTTIEVLNGAVQDLEAVMVVVKAKREDLKDIQRRLKDQQTMCREEISLGGRWGSPVSPRVRETAPSRSLADEELHAMMDSALSSPPGPPISQEGPIGPDRGEKEAPELALSGGGRDADYDRLLPAWADDALDPDLFSSP